MKTIAPVVSRATQRKIRRIFLNFFRSMVFMKPLKPCLIEVGDEHLMAKALKMQNQFDKIAKAQQAAVALRKQESIELEEKLNKQLADLKGERAQLREMAARNERISARVNEFFS